MTDTTGRTIIVTRVINAPRKLVFDVWTDPKHVSEWWGPRGFTTTTSEASLKPGGVWRYTMHGPDGVDYPNRVVYLEIVRPERLVYDHNSDLENDPEEFHVTVTFEDLGGRTRVTLHSLFATVEECDRVKGFGAVEGGNHTLDRLAEFLAKGSGG